MTVAFKVDVRVRATHPARAGRLGTVIGTDSDNRMANIRWDDPGMDDEWMQYIFLSTDDVPAEVPFQRQPDPVPNDLPHVADMVVDRVRARKAAGLREYGTPLQPYNGRDPMADLLDELLDGAHYLVQAMWERDHPATGIVDGSVQAKLDRMMMTAQSVKGKGGLQGAVLESLAYAIEYHNGLVKQLNTALGEMEASYNHQKALAQELADQWRRHGPCDG